MKRNTRIIALLLALTLCLAFALSACKPADDGNTGASDVKDDESVTKLNLWSFTEEVPNMMTRYKELFPDRAKVEIVPTIIATTDGAYQPALDQALAGGGSDAPDIYCAEAAFVKKYTQGDASSYAATYKSLGIDVEALIKESDIANYAVEIGTRGNDVVGLGYQATGGAYIYRRSIAVDVWGTDDPSVIKTKIGPGWDKFFAAAEELKAKGYGIVSGDGDIWHAVENSASQGWVVDGKLVIDPKREEFLDLSKKLKDNGYHNDTEDWQDAWFADMKDAGAKKIFGYFGPAWLINYVMAGNAGDTYGDWAVCESPVGFFWGGTWLIANKDTKLKSTVGDFIEWVTLDSSETGLQHYWANGTLMQDAKDAKLKEAFATNGIVKDAVASGKVMAGADGALDFLNGQNMFDAFIPAGESASGKSLTQYDERINTIWRGQVREYTAGNKTKEQAIADFKQLVKDELDIDAA